MNSIHMHNFRFLGCLALAMLFTQCADSKPEEKPIPMVNIGEQTWMDADLSTRTFINGDSILEVKTDQSWVDACKQSKPCFRILENGAFMYNEFALKDARGLCPKGFRIPTQADFEKLISFFPIGKSDDALATYSYFVEEWIGGADGGLET
ncbi:MAG: FISUMP domain-containing protein, partial [Flavobacteriales bacterium]